MYDILQLNDMLVPELLDIAEQLDITNSKKMDKQELIYKILDKQAIAGAATDAKADNTDKTRRRRIVKASTANSTEEAVVEEIGTPEPKAEKKAAAPKKEAPKRGRKKAAEEDGGVDGNDAAAIEAALAQPAKEQQLPFEEAPQAAEQQPQAQQPQATPRKPAQPQQNNRPQPQFNSAASRLSILNLTVSSLEKVYWK
jgi:transcription termination factor Rho